MSLEIPDSLFGSISTEEFLADYWQTKPLLVRNAWPNFISPILPTGLKELACREDALSRLILERGGDYPWEARFGPFEMDDFKDLPDSHWTLLIQHVDQLHPDVGRMLEAVDFLPNWRIDDIMISYAPGEGGVGAHIDNYDVFLLQGHGRRRWQIDTRPIEEESLVPDLDVRILADFEATEEWVLEPGDLLYLPPRIAHFGVALGHCMTYSIGCRAPSREGLLAGFLDHILSSLESERFYSDPGRSATNSPGAFDPQIKEFAKTAIQDFLTDGELFDRWLGQHLTMGTGIESVDDQNKQMTLDNLLHIMSTGGRLRPVSASRVAFDRLGNGQLVLFANGESINVASELESFLDQLTRSAGVDAADMPNAGTVEYDVAAELAHKLYSSGTYRLS
jgi:50S ribosomal protein L16 3-hydroxylase